ncbi:MAG: hypothetical protein D6763_08220 [Alphaproteobacteria bacterium]|nr:MAG: hypothetical protein D6763_08220 [Alphaproteobacteria bacterium]
MFGRWVGILSLRFCIQADLYRLVDIFIIADCRILYKPSFGFSSVFLRASRSSLQLVMLIAG